MEASYGYDGLDHFDVHLRRTDDPDVTVGLRLSRRGLAGWHLTRIELPNLLSTRGGADAGVGKLLQQAPR